MDPRVMELRIRQWIPVFEEQAKSGLNKDVWCILNGINRGSFFRWQRRVRSYLLEHGEPENTGQLQVSAVNASKDNECFVELPCPQAAVPGIASLRNLHDDISDDAAPISIRYGGFSVHVDGMFDEEQLTAVLRAIKLLDCPPVIVFCYELTRGTDHLRTYFQEFLGYITCDAYVSYQVLENESGGKIQATGCLMHCRRYFAEAFFCPECRRYE